MWEVEFVKKYGQERDFTIISNGDGWLHIYIPFQRGQLIRLDDKTMLHENTISYAR